MMYPYFSNAWIIFELENDHNYFINVYKLAFGISKNYNLK